MMPMEPPIRWRGAVAGGNGGVTASDRILADEVPVAIVINGTTIAVLLATPDDLSDFAVGFALTEGLVACRAEAGAAEIVHHPEGIEARLSIADTDALTVRRRTIAGPSGCGLCGVESLAAVHTRPRVVSTAGPMPTPAEIVAAMAMLGDAQPLGRATRAVHGAALWRRGQPLIVREDVGRHNALDKLVGAVAGDGDLANTAAAMLLLTSRVSVEMVQKAAVLGAPIVVAVSAPTRLAVATAMAAGLTLVAVARSDGFEVFAGAERIAW